MSTPIGLKQQIRRRAEVDRDWGVEEQRLAELNRRVGRWALRAQLAILGTAGAFGALGLPIMVKNILLGFAVSFWGAAQ